MVLLEKCFYHLDIIEKDYFGLQYTDHNNVSVSISLNRAAHSSEPFFLEI